MSRTHRYNCFTDDSRWAYSKNEWPDNWRWQAKYWRKGSQLTKQHTDRLRRSEDRLHRHKAMIDPEHDWINNKKKYLGIVWIYE